MLRREEIYERVWGYAMAHGDRSVDVFVRKLRQKLRAMSPYWSYIHTHFGVGYRFAPELESGSRRARETPRWHEAAAAGADFPAALSAGPARSAAGRPAPLIRRAAHWLARSQFVHIVVTTR